MIKIYTQDIHERVVELRRAYDGNGNKTVRDISALPSAHRKFIHNSHALGDDNIHPSWYLREERGDGHEAARERVHGRRTGTRDGQREEYSEELAEATQR